VPTPIATLPLALYVHLPWCVRKCPYCDFNSHTAPALLPHREYVEALLADLELDLAHVNDRAISSIFFGGGTPSLFAPEYIDSFLKGVRARVPVEADAEITLEANPGTIERGRFEGYRAAGINRVSLGAQSFNAEQLRVLGRIHAADDVVRAVEELRGAGIENFNLDLMYALPQQTVEEALQDLRCAIELAPAHLSHYQLTLEPGTVFYHRPPPLPDDEVAWEMQLRCQEELARAGYEQYEVSAYAREAQQCRHNLNYWRFGDYLGIGAGAHGKITQANEGVVRTVRAKQPREYLMRSPNARVERSKVDESELAFEFMLNALRLKDGFDIALFEARTGLAWESIREPLRAAQARGLLDMGRSTDNCRASELGQRFLNELQGLFLPTRPAPKVVDVT
jgi:oxygen-independent coproporphyrinogen-3 oxidase